MDKTISRSPVLEPFVISNRSTTNLHRRWEIWKDDFTLYTTASGITRFTETSSIITHWRDRSKRNL